MAPTGLVREVTPAAEEHSHKERVLKKVISGGGVCNINSLIIVLIYFLSP